MRLIDADALLYDLEIVPLTEDGGVDINDLEDIVKRQPTIAQPEWIPVTERLPEEEEQGDVGVIATVDGEENNVIYQHGIVPDAWYEEGRWYVNGVRLENAKVTAWMPQPEPYQEVPNAD